MIPMNRKLKKIKIQKKGIQALIKYSPIVKVNVQIAIHQNKTLLNELMWTSNEKFQLHALRKI